MPRRNRKSSSTTGPVASATNSGYVCTQMLRHVDKKTRLVYGVTCTFTYVFHASHSSFDLLTAIEETFPDSSYYKVRKITGVPTFDGSSSALTFAHVNRGDAQKITMKPSRGKRIIAIYPSQDYWYSTALRTKVTIMNVSTCHIKVDIRLTRRTVLTTPLGATSQHPRELTVKVPQEHYDYSWDLLGDSSGAP